MENSSRGGTGQLRSQLACFQSHQFTGRIDLTIAPNQTWSLYLALGRLAWASGGPHSMRRWRRQLLSHQLTQTAQQIKVRQNDQFECWDYQILTLLATRQLANTDTVMQIIHGIVTEVLFEISQAFQLALLGDAVEQSPAHPSNPTEPLSITPRLGVRPSTADTAILPRSWTVEIDAALDIAQADWEQWAQAGLALCSPNLAPVIKQHGHLQSSTPPKVYQQLAELVNGKRTLRDIAILLKRDVVSITKSLLPYIRKHYIGLVEVNDIPGPAPQAAPDPALPPRTETRPDKASVPSKGRVICIDDSPQIGHALQDLLQNAGYEVIWIQEAVQALPTLLQKKPDFVLLDLMMPIANGYEICSQIRRVGQFKDLPVVILTSNDGLVDRVRAKVVGATDFLSKPINGPKVLGILTKHGLG
ncbi:response regulator [Spirulina major]|uniref:response regulator n=1 Tax=Spirulina major TaxID=270636 RepID=UPI0009355891|nr:response regulator [Spirulina major]